MSTQTHSSNFEQPRLELCHLSRGACNAMLALDGAVALDSSLRDPTR